jgi:uncharacterized glyoxalase superfamily protein PhnB
MAENRIEEVYPYLRTRNAIAAIEFYKRAFGAVEDFRLTEPSGRVGHAELKFGETTVMVSDEYPEYGIHGPKDGVPTGSSIHLHVADVDAMTQQAVAAGAKLVMEPKDQFHGERSSRVLDPFGHEWLLGSHIEDVSRQEMQQMQRRFAEMFKGKA